MTMNINKYLTPTEFIDSGNSTIIEYAEQFIVEEHDQGKQAIKLYYAVRDNIRYDPYRIRFTAIDLKASSILNQGYGYCVTKALLLVALGRSVGIPSRLGFADVRNHLSSEKLKQIMQSDIFFWHGYTEFYLNNKWVKSTPAFNKSLCDKAGIKPLEFDGRTDSIFHEFDQAGNKHMEYIKVRGEFDDLPLREIILTYKKQYPALAKAITQSPEVVLEGSFENDASSD